MGDLMTLVGAVFFAVDMAVVGHIGRTRDVSVLTSWMFLFVGLFSLAATTAFEPRVPAGQWTPEIVGQLVFLAVVCTTIGLLLQNQALSAYAAGDRFAAALAREPLGRAVLRPHGG